MSLFYRVVGIGLAVFVAFGTPTDVRADGPTASQVIVVDVNGNLMGFFALREKIEALSKKLGVGGKSRVMQGIFAGAETGSVAVVVEYPDVVTLAQSFSALSASPELQAIGQEAQSLGIQIVSRSVYIDITP